MEELTLVFLFNQKNLNFSFPSSGKCLEITRQNFYGPTKTEENILDYRSSIYFVEDLNENEIITSKILKLLDQEEVLSQNF